MLYSLNTTVQTYNQRLWELFFSALALIQLCLVTIFTSVLSFLMALVPLGAPLSTGIVSNLCADFSVEFFH